MVMAVDTVRPDAAPTRAVSGRTRSRTAGWLMAAVMAAMVAAGAVLMGHGFSAGEQEMPLPNQPVHAEPAQVAVGPFQVEVDGAEMFVDDPAVPASHLFIPAIGSASPIDTADARGGVLRLPEDPGRVGLWTGGASLADPSGVVLLGGHVTNGPVRGSLFELASLQPGHVAYTTDAAGAVRMWQLESLRAVERADAAGVVADLEQGSWLVVVTCGGPVTSGPDGVRHYRDNVVAVFKPLA